MPLGIHSYRDVQSLDDTSAVLNLAWTADEREFLAVDLDAVLREDLAQEIRSGLDFLHRYFVKDPWAEALLGPAVATFFEQPPGNWSVTAGAGVGSLIHALARAVDGTAHVVGDTYPDFPFWVEQNGGRCVAYDRSAVRDRFVFVDRPDFIGIRFAGLDEVVMFCEEVAADGGIVIVDESNANYASPRISAVNVAGRLDNVIVLRGFSKAYGLGALRLGYCVASAKLTDRVRACIPPLLGSSLSLRLGVRILELGDITAPLRARILQQKAELARLLANAGLRGVRESGGFLPYVLVDPPNEARAALERSGIAGKMHPMWSSSIGAVRYVYRLSAPLREDRAVLLREKLDGCSLE